MITGIIRPPFKEGEKVIIYQAYHRKLFLNWKKAAGILFLNLALALLLIFLSPFLVLYLQKPKPPPADFGAISAQEYKPIANKIIKINFLLSIDKLGLKEAKVIKDVDINNESIYGEALKQGLVHAKGTAYPGEGKMVYIVGHSTNYPWFVKDLNALFFKIETLEAGDLIKLEYNSEIFNYQVSEKQIVKSNAVDIFNLYKDQDILILQSCWPPGTSWQRILIIAKPI